jgi:hypothetical protein
MKKLKKENLKRLYSLLTTLLIAANYRKLLERRILEHALRLERKFEKSLNEWFKLLRKDIEFKLKRAELKHTKELRRIEREIDWKKIRSLGEEIFFAMYCDVFRNALIEKSAVIAGGVLDKAAVDWAAKKSSKLVKEVTKETQKAIASIISSSIEAGIHPFKAARLLKDIVGLNFRLAHAFEKRAREIMANPELSEKMKRLLIERYRRKLLRYRREMIARTEIARSRAEAALLRYKKYKINEVEFFATPGACSKCLAKRGVYRLSRARGMIPVHPHCRCGWRRPLRLEEIISPKTLLALSEAEKFALENYLRELGSVDFRGLDIELVNLINKSVIRAYNQWGVRFDYIGTLSGFLNYMKRILPPDIFKEVRNYYALTFLRPQVIAAGIKPSLATGLKNGILLKENYFGKKSFFQKIVERNFKTGFFKSAKPEHIILHEYGHIVSFEYNIAKRTSFWNKLSNTLEKLGKSMRDVIGAYPDWDREEIWASLFAYYYTGDLKDKEIRKLIEELLESVKKGG